MNEQIFLGTVQNSKLINNLHQFHDFMPLITRVTRYFKRVVKSFTFHGIKLETVNLHCIKIGFQKKSF